MEAGDTRLRNSGSSWNPAGRKGISSTSRKRAGRRADERGKGKMSIWVTSDERHIPIKARLSHEVGQLDLTLKQIQRDENR